MVEAENDTASDERCHNVRGRKPSIYRRDKRGWKLTAVSSGDAWVEC